MSSGRDPKTSTARGDTPAVTAIVEAWSARDLARALLPADRALVRASGAARTLVADLVLAANDSHDLFNACAVLGHLMGKEGGSPTLAASTVDGLREALGAGDLPWLADARAAVFEGYVAARNDASALEAKRRWEYPRCAVRLEKGAIAIAAGYPDSDGEDLADWAARVARSAVADGVRRARVSGAAPSVDALGEAFALAGVDVTRDALPITTPSRSWLPWRRGT